MNSCISEIKWLKFSLDVIFSEIALEIYLWFTFGLPLVSRPFCNLMVVLALQIHFLMDPKWSLVVIIQMFFRI